MYKNQFSPAKGKRQWRDLKGSFQTRLEAANVSIEMAKLPGNREFVFRTVKVLDENEK